MVRGVTEIKGLSETRTLQGSKKRAMPRSQNATYLGIFILGKERDRLEKAMFVIDKRKMNMQRRLDEITVEMEKLKAEEVREQRTSCGTPKSHHKKGWKTMAMTY